MLPFHLQGPCDAVEYALEMLAARHEQEVAAAADNASDGTSSASEGSERSPPQAQDEKAPTPTEPAYKRRKSTYYNRRDEIELLQEQVKVLKEKLLLAERGIRVEVEQAAQEPKDSKALGTFFEKTIDRNNIRIASTQAMLTTYNLAVSNLEAPVPLSSYIHLPDNGDQRRAVLMSIRNTRLRSAYQYMAERSRGIDLSVTQHQNEHFDLPNGDIVIMGFDVNVFDSGHSLRQVNEAFMYYIRNQEITMSAELGVLTIRESDELEDCMVCQARLLSSIPGALEIESNTVMGATVVEAKDGQPAYGVGFVDFVDQDDLYPYRPDQCARKDMTGAILLREIPRQKGGGGPLIALCRWAVVRFRRPHYPISRDLIACVRKRMNMEDGIAFEVMRDRLSTIPPDSA